MLTAATVSAPPVPDMGPYCPSAVCLPAPRPSPPPLCTRSQTPTQNQLTTNSPGTQPKTTIRPLRHPPGTQPKTTTRPLRHARTLSTPAPLTASTKLIIAATLTTTTTMTATRSRRVCSRSWAFWSVCPSFYSFLSFFGWGGGGCFCSVLTYVSSM
jgi:hypothetical protein